MRVVEHSSASVEATLSELETAYGSFPVNQTTVAVSADRYERAREADKRGRIDLYATVQNGEGAILHVDGGSSRVLPGVSVERGTSLEPTLESAVREKTGVECRLDEVTEARIVGIRDRSRDDRETVYRLAVVFEARYRAGSTTDDACWLEDIQGLPVRAETRD